VRFEHLHAEAEVRVGSSGLPTVLNSITNKLEVCQGSIGLIVQCVRACVRERLLTRIWSGGWVDGCRKPQTPCAYWPAGSGLCPSSMTLVASSSPAGEIHHPYIRRFAKYLLCSHVSYVELHSAQNKAYIFVFFSSQTFLCFKIYNL
jgi:hypothetical protein